jgi:excisionase family DNA binding protein
MENDLEPAVHLLTLKETAELLQLSTRTLKSMAQGKKVPAFKIGNLWRFRESELAKWIQGLNEL